MTESAPEGIDNQEIINFLNGILEDGIEGDEGSKLINASGEFYDAGLESHPLEGKIYIAGKFNDGNKFNEWINTEDGSTSKNFMTILKIVYPV